MLISISSNLFAAKYFQQSVGYEIHVTLDAKKGVLHANEAIMYTNNSSNTLNYLYFHLWPNGYKNPSTALAKQLLESGKTDIYYAENPLGYIDSLNFSSDNTPLKWEFDSTHIDICKIILNKPLHPGETITISTPFRVKLPPSGLSRLGCTRSTFQISQWYPKPAVYDMNGWHQMPYLDQGEFYSEYGSFDVYITVPKNYEVAATGDLIDNDEETAYLNSLAEQTKAFTAAEAIKIAKDTVDSKQTKTLHFKQNNVHDFAWFTNRNFVALKGEVTLPESDHKVNTWVFFPPEVFDLWSKSIEYVNDAVLAYSKWIGEYPYNHATAVYGGLGAGGGMEYPNITVIGDTPNDRVLETVIVHEVGHNWFYGLLGSNERIHAWMDEGINSYYENRYFAEKYPNEGIIQYFGSGKEVAEKFDLTDFKRSYQNYLMYIISARSNKDQALNTTSENFTDGNYGSIVYAKGACAFSYLSSYLGETAFDNAMHLYFNEWYYKHPGPNDLKQALEASTNKNLDWFFNNIISGTAKIDYKVVAIKHNKDSYDVIVKNKTNTPTPISLYGIKNNKPVAMVWYDGFTGKQTLGFPPLEVDYFKLDFTESIPETNRNNNTIKNKGLFKKAAKPKLQFLGSIDHPDKAQLFYTPVYGYNNYNKNMLGLAFYNKNLPSHKFEFLAVPMYSFGTKNIAGHISVIGRIQPKIKFIREVTLEVAANKYGYGAFPFHRDYEKLSESLDIYFKNKNARNKNSHSLKLRQINLNTEDFIGFYDNPSPLYVKDTSYTHLLELSYNWTNTRKINPFSFKTTAQHNSDITKLFAELNYEITFKGNNRNIKLRAFAGSFLHQRSDINAIPYRFRLSGQTGTQDYLFDNYYIGRSEYDGLMSKQFTETDGAFKILSPIGQNTSWMTTLNIESSIPFIKLPIRLFVDLGYVPDDKSIVLNDNFFYSGGVMLTIADNIFEIFVPLFSSNDLNNYLELNNIQFKERIRFTLNLNKLNPFKLIDQFQN